MSAGMPELGSKISLISKADIRYEGCLFTVDPQECTIALASVRSFGTEDRETKFLVPPQNQVYDYILFRGSDIKDIRVLNNAPPMPNDPAIMQLSAAPPPVMQQQQPQPSLYQSTGPYGSLMGHMQQTPFGQQPNVVGGGGYGNLGGGLLGAVRNTNVPQMGGANNGVPPMGDLLLHDHEPVHQMQPLLVPLIPTPPQTHQQQQAGANPAKVLELIGGGPTSNLHQHQHQQHTQSQQQQHHHHHTGVSNAHSRSNTPVSLGGAPVQRKSPTADQGTQAGGAHHKHAQPPPTQQQRTVGGGGGQSAVKPTLNRNHHQQQQQQQQQSPGGASMNNRQPPHHQQSYHQNNYHPNNRQPPPHQQQQGGWVHQNNQQQRGGGQMMQQQRQRGRPRGGQGGGGNIPGTFRPPSNQQQQLGQKPKNTLKFDNDYDFELANTEFEELRSQLGKIKIDDKPPTSTTADHNGTSTDHLTPSTITTTTKDHPDTIVANNTTDSSNETNISVGVGGGDTTTTTITAEQYDDDGSATDAFYNKSKSFFDNISCEAVERSKGRSQRTDWRTERKLNTETFGVSASRRGGFRGRGYHHRGGMGTGYGYHRGGAGGGYNQRGYNNNRHNPNTITNTTPQQRNNNSQLQQRTHSDTVATATRQPQSLNSSGNASAPIPAPAAAVSMVTATVAK